MITVSYYDGKGLARAEVEVEKRDALIAAGFGNADAILNVLHQAGWAIVPKAALARIRDDDA